MAFFSNKADEDLPLLTQFYQLTVPENWREANWSDEGGGTHPLIQSELDQWLLRCHVLGLLPARSMDNEMIDALYPGLPLDDKTPAPENVRFYSKLIHSELLERWTFKVLAQFASLHDEMVPVIRGFAHADLSAEGTTLRMNLLLTELNRRFARAPLGSFLIYTGGGVLETEPVSADRLETELLFEFSKAASVPVGNKGGLDTCPVCDSVYIKLANDQTLCSKRCGDRSSKRNQRLQKKI